MNLHSASEHQTLKKQHSTYHMRCTRRVRLGLNSDWRVKLQTLAGVRQKVFTSGRL